jgi:hypothetical protein
MTYDLTPGFPSRKWLTQIPDVDIEPKIALHHIACRYGPLPDHDEICLGTGELTAIGSQRPDFTLVLLNEGRSVFGIVVEPLRYADEVKRYSWPAFAATLRARLRCPVCLLVIPTDEMLTEWAKKPIELGGDNRFVPYVLELLAWRETVDLLAKGDPRLGRLSAVLNARNGISHA